MRESCLSNFQHHKGKRGQGGAVSLSQKSDRQLPEKSIARLH
ncbi:hypothetical protein QUA00_23035 [Microcoleus sp. T2B6]